MLQNFKLFLRPLFFQENSVNFYFSFISYFDFLWFKKTPRQLKGQHERLNNIQMMQNSKYNIANDMHQCLVNLRYNRVAKVNIIIVLLNVSGLNRNSKFAYDDIKEVHKRRYLLQPIAVEVFSSDGRNYLLAFPRKLRNKVYAKWVLHIDICWKSVESHSWKHEGFWVQDVCTVNSNGNSVNKFIVFSSFKSMQVGTILYYAFTKSYFLFFLHMIWI